MKTKTKMYDDIIYTYFPSLIVPEGGVESKSFTIISIDSLLVYENNITCKYIQTTVLKKL